MDLRNKMKTSTFKELKRNCDRFIVFLQKDPSGHRKSKYKSVIACYDRTIKDIL